MANNCVKALPPCELCTNQYAPTSQSALNCKKAARKSGFPFACARLLLFPTKCPRCAVVLCGDPDRRGCFRVLHPNIALSELAFGQASSSTPFLFRRRFNEHSERDALRHDVISFEVEPLTSVHSFGDVFEPDENFFGDGITRRSAKLAQRALAPALASRGALSERRATP